MTPDERPFIEAILCDPAADLPRLVYADWLEERDSDRAEFVRVQCRIAELQRTCLCGTCVRLRGGGQHHNGRCLIDRERVELPDGYSQSLRRRERDLLATYGSDAWGGWPCGASIEIDRGKTLRRGFVSSISCSAADWLQHGPQIVRCQPVEEVRLTDAFIEDTIAKQWGPFLKDPAWAGLRIQSSDGEPTPEGEEWAYWWGQAALTWARQEPCPQCGGIGHIHRQYRCITCWGRGTVDFRTLLRKPPATGGESLQRSRVARGRRKRGSMT